MVEEGSGTANRPLVSPVVNLWADSRSRFILPTLVMIVESRRE